MLFIINCYGCGFVTGKRQLCLPLTLRYFEPFFYLGIIQKLIRTKDTIIELRIAEATTIRQE